jgi:hypothetical protein
MSATRVAEAVTHCPRWPKGLRRCLPPSADICGEQDHRPGCDQRREGVDRPRHTHCRRSSMFFVWKQTPAEFPPEHCLSRRGPDLSGCQGSRWPHIDLCVAGEHLVDLTRQAPYIPTALTKE